LSFQIAHYIRISKGRVVRDNEATTDELISGPDELYKAIGANYPKFFKMDILCRWAWAACEHLLIYKGLNLSEVIDKEKVALVFATAEGCIDVDKKYKESIATIPSPALFVYTLPNIMLGEICIRHGFKGEQACIVNKQFDSEALYFRVNDLLENRGMEACLCGWVNATNLEHDVCMFWVTKGKTGIQLSPAALQELYNNN
jgi:hypothetical protein